MERGRRRFPERRRLIGCGFVAAMIVAPFLALAYGFTAALATTTCALAATTFLAADAARAADPGMRRRLAAVAVANGVLVLTCFAVLLVRVA